MSHALTIAAATRNITTAVVVPADSSRPYSCENFQLAVDEHADDEAVAAATTAASVA
jgi:hypothetical protein